MEFANVNNDMQREFMILYNEKVGKKPFYWGLTCGVVLLVIGYFALSKIIAMVGWYGKDFPTWFLVVFLAWFVVGLFLGGKFGVRMYHKMHRDSLVSSICQALSDDPHLTDEQKETLRNYTVYYVDTTTLKLRDFGA